MVQYVECLVYVFPGSAGQSLPKCIYGAFLSILYSAHKKNAMHKHQQILSKQYLGELSILAIPACKNIVSDFFGRKLGKSMTGFFLAVGVAAI